MTKKEQAILDKFKNEVNREIALRAVSGCDIDDALKAKAALINVLACELEEASAKHASEQEDELMEEGA